MFITSPVQILSSRFYQISNQMKEVVRIIDLVNFEGIGLMEVESNSLVKEAVYYLHEKTKDLSDGEYIEWLKNKKKNGFMLQRDIIEVENDLFQDERFLFMQKDYRMLPFDLVTVFDLALDQNGLKDPDYKHLIDSYD